MLGILLAAGRGTRMKSESPKVLFQINGECLCWGPLEALLKTCDRVVVVVGYKGEEVKSIISRAVETYMGQEVLQSRIQFCTQDPPQGTGDAVRTALAAVGRSLSQFPEVVVVNGDLPLIRESTIKRLAAYCRERKIQSACLSMMVRQPKGLGRILRDETGIFSGIREEKDAKPFELKIREVNGGVYFFQRELLETEIQNLKSNNSQKEFYLTDLLGNLHVNRVRRSEAVLLKNSYDLMGVNNTWELAGARSIAQARLHKELSEMGVEVENPMSTFVGRGVKFHGPCYIGPGSYLFGKTEIATGVRIEGNCRIFNTRIDSSSVIEWGSVLEDSIVGVGCKVGPMARLRPGSELEEGVKIGNFVELKKTKMKARSKASHLSYLGDAEVGEESNIGCGTITCNYDGFNKNRTIIGKRAFIGSDSQLVAPVTVGDEAYVGSGTTVTQDVPAGSLALSRSELVIKADYATKLFQKKMSKKDA